jgi:MerR family transcriptional regulator, light-induced transcriptional regulator
MQRENCQMARTRREDRAVIESVVELERATGIPRGTLRVWERRYGFPQPERDARGRRVYDAPQLKKLQLIAQLLARGERPGNLVNQSVRELTARLQAPAASSVQAADGLVGLLQTLDHSALMQHLLQQLTAMGLERFVCEAIALSNVTVGEAWACGELEVRGEHLYTETVQQILRAAIVAQPLAAAASAPRVLLAAPTGEHHALGLLMAHAIFAVHRCPCLPLGPNLSAEQISAAARSWHADVIAISVSRALPVRNVSRFLDDLRKELPAVRVWAGGRNKALSQRADASATMRVFESIGDLPAAIEEYRAARSAAR